MGEQQPVPAPLRGAPCPPRNVPVDAGGPVPPGERPERPRVAGERSPLPHVQAAVRPGGPQFGPIRPGGPAHDDVRPFGPASDGDARPHEALPLVPHVRGRGVPPEPARRVGRGPDPRPGGECQLDGDGRCGWTGPVPIPGPDRPDVPGPRATPKVRLLRARRFGGPRPTGPGPGVDDDLRVRGDLAPLRSPRPGRLRGVGASPRPRGTVPRPGGSPARGPRPAPRPAGPRNVGLGLSPRSSHHVAMEATDLTRRMGDFYLVASEVLRDVGDITEQQISHWIVSPFLVSLGWDPHDKKQVYLDYPVKPEGHVDYALLDSQGQPRLIVDVRRPAKPTTTDAGDVVKKARAVGAPLALITNGQEFSLWYVAGDEA